MAVRVKFNHLPKVISRLRPECSDAVDKTTNQIAAIAKAGVPKWSGILADNTKAVLGGNLHGEIRSGIRYGHGFYAGHVEFGAAQPGGKAQPYMIPAAHKGEPIFTRNMTAAVREACKV